MEESHHQCCCLLDLNYSSNLLSTKIADIPHKLKYETIIAPIFEYCFGTSDQDIVWEELTKKEEEEYPRYSDSFGLIGEFVIESNNSIINLKIDWIRDETYLYSQIFNLVTGRLYRLGVKLGLWNNRQFVLKSCSAYNYSILAHSNSRFRNDRELVMVAITRDGKNLKFVSDELKNDKEIVMQAVKQNGNAFRYASEELRDDKEILLIALETYESAYRYASERLKNDREVVFKAVLHDCFVYYISERFNNDRELLLMSSNIDGYATLTYACLELQNDKEIVMQAVQENPNAFKLAADELKNDREFVKEIVMKQCECLRYTSKELKDDSEIVELALKSNPDAIHYISERLRNDTEFISKLIGKRGFTYRLPEEFSNDREIVLESIKINPRNMESASIELQNDREFILHVVTNCGMALEYVKQEFKSDGEIVMAAITQNGNAFNYVDKQFTEDKEIILKAAEHHLDDLIFNKLSDRLKKDREVLLKCATAIRSFPRKYHLDREFILEALKTNPKVVISIAYPLIVNDRVLAMRIVKRDGLLLGELPLKYRNDREIVSFAIQQNKEAFKFVSDELKNDSQILKLL